MAVGTDLGGSTGRAKAAAAGLSPGPEELCSSSVTVAELTVTSLIFRKWRASRSLRPDTPDKTRPWLSWPVAGTGGVDGPTELGWIEGVWLPESISKGGEDGDSDEASLPEMEPR